MTKEFAIAETKKLWREIKASGLSKAGFLGTKQGRKWLKKGYRGNCPLCEYAEPTFTNIGCGKCLLIEKYNKNCYALGYSSFVRKNKFFEAIENL